jgi:hypothetical protein
MSTISTIQRLTNLLERNVTQINPTLSYNRVVRALELLGLAVHRYNGETEDWLDINDCSYGPESFIEGGYWHLTEWHGGQWSDTYRAMCSLGTVFNPGMTDGPEPESCEKDIYEMLDQLAEIAK